MAVFQSREARWHNRCICWAGPTRNGGVRGNGRGPGGGEGAAAALARRASVHAVRLAIFLLWSQKLGPLELRQAVGRFGGSFGRTRCGFRADQMASPGLGERKCGAVVLSTAMVGRGGWAFKRQQVRKKSEALEHMRGFLGANKGGIIRAFNSL